MVRVELLPGLTQATEYSFTQNLSGIEKYGIKCEMTHGHLCVDALSDHNNTYIILPMQSLDLTPEYREKSEKLKVVKELYLTFLLQYNDLLNVIKPNLTAIYLIKVGEKQLQLLEKQARVAALKYKLELLQAALNRKENPDIAAIEADIARKMEDYARQIADQAAKIEEAHQHTSHLMSAAESTELKKTYYSLAKKLHPDVNPEQSDKEKSLWLIVSLAYQMGDLESLNNVNAALSDVSVKEMVLSSHDLVQKEIDLYEKRLADVSKKTTSLKSEFPFTYEEKLSNDNWVESESARIDGEIDLLKETEQKLEIYIEMILEALK